MDYPHYYIQEFKKYLSLQTSSVNTIKNYLSDLRLFFNFIVENQRQNLTPQSLPSFISLEFLKTYEDFLFGTNPPATTKRRLSSLKKFIDYCATQDISPAPTITIAPPPLPSLSSFQTASLTPVSYPIAPETPIVMPPEIPPLTATPPDEISNLVKSLANQTPVENVSSPPPPVSPSPQPENIPADYIPDQKPVPANGGVLRSFSPYLVALTAFLVTFLLTFLISLFLTRT